MKEKFDAIKKFNFWDKNTPKLGFYRTEYTDKILAYTGNSLVKVLVGQRRTGKSYILRQLINKLISEGVNKKNILYINKEYTEFDFITNYSELDISTLPNGIYFLRIENEIMKFVVIK